MRQPDRSIRSSGGRLTGGLVLAGVIQLFSFTCTAHAELTGVDRPSSADSFPILPAAAQHWPGILTICILGLFLAAAVIGPLIRANAPDEVPSAHAHDEPPGASHHHGKSGEYQPDPDDLTPRGPGH